MESTRKTWLVRTMATELSDGDLRKILGRRLGILTSADLSTADELPFDDQGRLVILFLEEPHEGHWTCIMHSADGKELYYFDPYGFAPDAVDGYVAPGLLPKLGVREKAVTDLLNKQALPWHRNPVDYQSEASTVETCGRWVATRLMHKNLSPAQFKEWVETTCPPTMPKDAFVTLLTERALGHSLPKAPQALLDWIDEHNKGGRIC